MSFALHHRSCPSLILLIGPPCSGKTTWVSQTYTPSPHRQTVVISSDAIIEDAAKVANVTYTQAFEALDHTVVLEEVYRLFDKAMTQNHDIVLDRTNLYTKSRARFLDRISSHYRRVAVVFNTPKQVINQRTADRDLIGDKIISMTEITRMIDTYEPPSFIDFDVICQVPSSPV